MACPLAFMRKLCILCILFMPRKFFLHFFAKKFAKGHLFIVTLHSQNSKRSSAGKEFWPNSDLHVIGQPLDDHWTASVKSFYDHKVKFFTFFLRMSKFFTTFARFLCKTKYITKIETV